MKKRLTGLLLTAVMLLLCVFAPLKQDKITEANTAYMKSSGVKWDLKEGKWVKIRSNFAGNVWVDRKATIKNLKIKDAIKEGYKELTCTVFIKKENPSLDKVYKIVNSKFFKKNKEICSREHHDVHRKVTSSSTSAGVYDAREAAYVESALAWVCDYNTGAALDDDNEFDVDCKCGLVYRNRDTVAGEEWLANDLKYKFTIVYPEDYKGLCIGVSGNGSYKKDVFAGKYLWFDYDHYDYEEDDDDDFKFYISNSGKDLLKSPVYRKDKENIHFIRIK